jgi:hypothetical protein
MGCKNSKRVDAPVVEFATVASPEETTAPPPNGTKETPVVGKTIEETKTQPEDTSGYIPGAGIVPGATVTTIDGRKGKVVDRTTADVTLEIDGNQEIVGLESIYRVKVTVCSARDLQAGDYFSGKSDPYVIARIGDEPKSQVQTTIKSRALSCMWNEEFELLGYLPGAKLQFEVWDKDTFKTDDLLGKFELESDRFCKTDFDQEVELPEASAKKTGSYLHVKVALLPPPVREDGAPEAVVTDDAVAPLFRFGCW